MERQMIEVTNTFLSPEERTRLIRLCARITGHVEVAEDLAQETLLEAWKYEHALRDVERRRQWLSGIARNVCLRWLRKHGRDAAHFIAPLSNQQSQNAGFANFDDLEADDLGVEFELERKELITLLDRALALLPAETRIALIQHYVEESPLAEIAAQLGTNASAVAMRLQRGKLVLRHVLTHEMGHELAPYALSAQKDEWEVTPLWCHLCGQHHFLGKRDPVEGRLLLKCPACSPQPEQVLSQNHLSLLKGMKSYKPALSRLMAWCDHYYREGLKNGTIACASCGRMLSVHICTLEEIPGWVVDDMPEWTTQKDERIVAILCEACRSSYRIPLSALVLALPQGRQFSRANPRIHLLPHWRVETEGREAIITRFESVTDNASLTVVSAYDTYQTLRIEQ